MSLIEMIEEVKDIAVAHEWRYRIFQNKFPSGNFNQLSFDNEAYGISFSPPECEPVSLVFLSNGKLVSLFQLHFLEKKQITKSEVNEYVSVKTQFAGVTVHKLVIHILKYISGKYLLNFELDDEGLYWETGDEKLVEEKFQFMDALLNSVQNALETKPMKAGETFEEYFQRVLKNIEENKKKSKN